MLTQLHPHEQLRMARERHSQLRRQAEHSRLYRAALKQRFRSRHRRR